MKNFFRSQFKCIIPLATCMILSSPAVHANDYPSRPVTLVVPFAPGGSTDILGRLIAEGLKERLGQSVVVDNKSGANGNIGTATAARAKPDGYTLLMANAGTNVINPSLYKNLTWDPIKDFTPLAMVARVDNVVVVTPNVKANSLKELAQIAHDEPSALNYGSVGVGSIFHLAGEIFSKEANVKMTHVAYRGANPAITDLASGNIQVMFATIPGAMGFVKSNMVKAIAVTGQKRSTVFPDLPTAVEAGYPDVVIDNWFAVLGPANLEAETRDKLIKALGGMVDDPAFQQKLREQGAEPTKLIGDDLKNLMIDDIARWKQIISSMNISIK